MSGAIESNAHGAWGLTASVWLADRSSVPLICVVDNEKHLHEKLSLLLSCLQAETKYFFNAESFLMMPRKASISCLLVEVNLPGVSGIELLERLNTEGHRIPTIVMAARGDVPTAVRAMQARAVDFFERPFADGALLRQVEKLCRRQSAAGREM